MKEVVVAVLLEPPDHIADETAVHLEDLRDLLRRVSLSNKLDQTVAVDDVFGDSQGPPPCEPAARHSITFAVASPQASLAATPG